jgi:DNA-binding phage protein
MKVKISRWDPYEGLDTEEAIQAFADAAIDEAKNDTDPKYLARCLGIAAEARRRLAVKNGISADAAEAECLSDRNSDPPLSVFNKVVRSFGYRPVFVPIQAG